MITSFEIHNARILVVDDQQANVLLLERMLRGAGYSSITSTMDPREVCALHAKNRYDLVLLDLEMPAMDGFTVMEGLREIEPDGALPILVITAQPDHKLRALREGAKDFVSKPLDLAEVLMRVYNLLETRLLQLETRKLYDQLLAEQEARRNFESELAAAREPVQHTFSQPG
jgi:PleD family two-component response regulator